MKRRGNAGWVALIGLALTVGCGGGGGGAATTRSTDYVFVDLGEIDPKSAVMALNDAGDVVATRRVGSGDTRHAFRWSRGVWKDIHPDGADDNSVALDINEDGQVLLYAAKEPYPGAYPRGHQPLLLRNGVYTPLRSAFPDSALIEATGLSEDGVVTGYYWEGERAIVQQPQTFLWRNGAITTLSGSTRGRLNRNQQFFGWTLGGGSSVTWLLRAPGKPDVPLTDLASNASRFSPSSISEAGVIAGEYTVDDDSSPLPAILHGGAMKPLFTEDSDAGTASATNQSGDVAGWTRAGAFLRRKSGEIVRFQSLFPPNTEVTFLSAINDRGEMTGAYGVSNVAADAPRHAFKLTPRNLAP